MLDASLTARAIRYSSEMTSRLALVNDDSDREHLPIATSVLMQVSLLHV